MYRRARHELDVALADVVRLLAHLDPTDAFVEGSDLLEVLAAWGDRIDDAIAGRPFDASYPPAYYGAPAELVRPSPDRL